MKSIDNYLKKYDKSETPGIAVMAIKEGEVIYKKGFGKRDLKTLESINSESNFRLASVSKQFTAMSVAILEDRKIISSDDFINNYIDELPEFTKDIKIKHLINHTSGIPDYMELCSDDPEAKVISNQDIIDLMSRKQSLLFPVGDKHEYSNTGYVLLASLVERASGISFPEFVKENIFVPLKMNNSCVVSYPLPEISSRVCSYGSWPHFSDIDYNAGNFLYGDGGIYSSLDDLEKWINCLSSNKLISDETFKRIFKTNSLNDGTEVLYSYGWFHTQNNNGVKKLYHSGGWVGFRNYIAHVPEKKLWFVILSNSSAVDLSSEVQFINKNFS